MIRIAFVILSLTTAGCDLFRAHGCTVLRAAADATCVILEQRDGTRVALSPEDLELAGRAAMARAARDGGAP